MATDPEWQKMEEVGETVGLFATREMILKISNDMQWGHDITVLCKEMGFICNNDVIQGAALGYFFGMNQQTELIALNEDIPFD